MPERQAFVLLITGPAGAGKSAAAAAWAATQGSPTAHIQLDDVREFVAAGYADPRDGWTSETQRQYEIARQNCADMARRYVAAGITCAIDDAIFPRWDMVNFEGWRQLLLATPLYLLVLAPTLAAVAERNARRHGRRLLAPEMLHTIYDMMEPWREQRQWPVIDTSSLSVAETALAIQQAVEDMRKQGNSR